MFAGFENGLIAEVDSTVQVGDEVRAYVISYDYKKLYLRMLYLRISLIYLFLKYMKRMKRITITLSCYRINNLNIP